MPGLDNNTIRRNQERGIRPNGFRPPLSPIMEVEEEVEEELAANEEVINVANQTNNLERTDSVPIEDSSYSSTYENSSTLEQEHIAIINQESINADAMLTRNGNRKRKNSPEADFNKAKRGCFH